MRAKGEGVDTSKCVHKSPFLHVFAIFSYAMPFCHTLLSLTTRLSLLFYKIFVMIIFCALKCLTAVFSMEMLIRYLKTFPLEMRGGVRWERVCIQWGV